jgi:hypothetical protein
MPISGIQENLVRLFIFFFKLILIVFPSGGGQYGGGGGRQNNGAQRYGTVVANAKGYLILIIVFPCSTTYFNYIKYIGELGNVAANAFSTVFDNK